MILIVEFLGRRLAGQKSKEKGSGPLIGHGYGGHKGGPMETSASSTNW
jgi:hypothetical protein